MSGLQNNTKYKEEDVEKWVIAQFSISGFVITQISDRHYRNRLLPKGKELVDIQIGYALPSKRQNVKYRVKDIQNLTIIVDKEMSEEVKEVEE